MPRSCGLTNWSALLLSEGTSQDQLRRRHGRERRGIGSAEQAHRLTLRAVELQVRPGFRLMRTRAEPYGASAPSSFQTTALTLQPPFGHIEATMRWLPSVTRIGSPGPTGPKLVMASSARADTLPAGKNGKRNCCGGEEF